MMMCDDDYDNHHVDAYADDVDAYFADWWCRSSYDVDAHDDDVEDGGDADDDADDVVVAAVYVDDDDVDDGVDVEYDDDEDGCWWLWCW